MAKRLTGTEKWRKEWFQNLTLKQKCIWMYLCDNCDLAGFWEENFRQAGFELGEQLSANDLIGIKDLSFVRPGLWRLTDFCQFQYGCPPEELDVNNRVHKAVIKVFEKRCVDRVSKTSDSLSAAPDSPLGGAKDKDKKQEQEKDIDQVKDKDTEKAAAINLLQEVTGAQAPIDEEHYPLEETLLQHWGAKGRLGYGVMTQFVDLIRSHGWERVEYAIKEAGSHSACSLAYVKGILSPTKKIDEITVGSKQDFFGFQTFLTQAGKKNGEGYSVEIAVPGKEWKFSGDGIGALYRQFKPGNSHGSQFNHMRSQ